MIVISHEVEKQAQLWEEGAYAIGTFVTFSALSVIKPNGTSVPTEEQQVRPGVLVGYGALDGTRHISVRRRDEHDLPYGPAKDIAVGCIRTLVETVEVEPDTEIVPEDQRFYL